MPDQTNFPQTNPVSFGNGLPPEYQQQIDSLLRQRQLAMAMQQMAMQPQMPQQGGPVAARISPLQPMLQALTGFMANKNASSAEQQMGQIQGQFQQSTTKEIQQLQGMDPQARLRAAESSRNPIVQALGQKWKDEYNKRLEGYATAVKDASPDAAAAAYQTGQIPATPLPAAREPVIETLDLGNGQKGFVIKNYKRSGEVTASAPSLTSVVNQLPGNEASTALGMQKTQLEGMQGDAKTAINALNQNRAAIEALQEGAQAGGGQDIKQTIRKVAQAFGIDLPATGSTDELQMALSQGILSHAKELRPMSDTDLAFLKKQAGSINSDPTALSKMLRITSAAALKQLQDYHSFVSGATKNAILPYSREMYQNALTGYDLPKQLFGPNDFQYGVIQELQKRGGDVSQFKDGSGQTFPENAQFNISNQPIQPQGGPAAAGGPPTTEWVWDGKKLVPKK